MFIPLLTVGCFHNEVLSGYPMRAIHDIERAKSEERKIDRYRYFTRRCWKHCLQDLCTEWERERAQKHRHGCVNCVTLLQLLEYNLWGDKQEELGKETCTVVVLWTVFTLPLQKVLSRAEPASAVHHKSTHGRKYTLKCYDGGANMPQTDQMTFFEFEWQSEEMDYGCRSLL